MWRNCFVYFFRSFLSRGHGTIIWTNKKKRMRKIRGNKKKKEIVLLLLHSARKGLNRMMVSTHANRREREGEKAGDSTRNKQNRKDKKTPSTKHATRQRSRRARRDLGIYETTSTSIAHLFPQSAATPPPTSLLPSPIIPTRSSPIFRAPRFIPFHSMYPQFNTHTHARTHIRALTHAVM